MIASYTVSAELVEVANSSTSSKNFWSMWMLLSSCSATDAGFSPIGYTRSSFENYFLYYRYFDKIPNIEYPYF